MRRPRQQHQHQQDPARDPGGSKLWSKIAHGARAPHRREEPGGLQGSRDAGCGMRCPMPLPLPVAVALSVPRRGTYYQTSTLTLTAGASRLNGPIMRSGDLARYGRTADGRASPHEWMMERRLHCVPACLHLGSPSRSMSPCPLSPCLCLPRTADPESPIIIVIVRAISSSAEQSPSPVHAAAPDIETN